MTSTPTSSAGPSAVTRDDIDMAEAPMTSLPPEMIGRADARELREFVLALRSIRDPESRRRILAELQNATT